MERLKNGIGELNDNILFNLSNNYKYYLSFGIVYYRRDNYIKCASLYFKFSNANISCYLVNLLLTNGGLNNGI